MAIISFHADEGEGLAALSEDVGSLWCRPVAVLDSPPDAFTFLRDFVHPNVPCIIKNAIPSHAASGEGFLRLTLDEIINHVNEDAKITVDVTPDGHGDCVRSVVLEGSDHDHSNQQQRRERRMFVKPHEQNMEIGKFRDLLRRCSGHDDTSNIGHAEENGGIGNAVEAVPKIDSNENGLEIFPLHSNRTAAANTSDGANAFDEVTRPPPVVYYSRQNDCLRTELSQLFATRLFPRTFPFAERAFGAGPPDAVNLWIGNERSASSMHKDHYENLFYVCSGRKEFVLCPPADVVFLHEGEFASGTFRPAPGDDADGETRDGSDRSSWVVADDDDGTGGSGAKTRWIEPDIKEYMENGTDEGKFPLISKAHPVKILVSEGEMLYVPSLWYHRVTQTCETVGVNYWYDMKFDSPHWCYFNFLQNLRKVERDDRVAS